MREVEAIRSEVQAEWTVIKASSKWRWGEDHRQASHNIELGEEGESL